MIESLEMRELHTVQCIFNCKAIISSRSAMRVCSRLRSCDESIATINPGYGVWRERGVGRPRMEKKRLAEIIFTGFKRTQSSRVFASTLNCLFRL